MGTNRRTPPGALATSSAAGRQLAFSLVELIAVMVICALLAGIVAVSVRGHVARARMSQALDMLASLDRTARHQARQGQRVPPLRIDSRQGIVVLPDGRKCWLGHSIRIKRLSTARATTTAGTLSVVMSSTGQSDSYAVLLAATNGLRRWLVVLGESGQHLRVDRDAEAGALLAVR